MTTVSNPAQDAGITADYFVSARPEMADLVRSVEVRLDSAATAFVAAADSTRRKTSARLTRHQKRFFARLQSE